ncbi:MAG: glucose-1-phosphate adenylyltransferase, partial [Firmicutes bacterium]|nr:glucose-1-phosphate adenylyltransferase [Bacillota bacterium]
TIGVLTQYQPLELNSYIGNGQPWDLDRLYGGAFILPPYVRGKEGEWYKGTANAIFQNINFIDMYNPEYVLILSGDHIYKMDYNKMLEYHKEKGSDCTIAVMRVPIEEASRFGVLNTTDDLKIYEFEEKPPQPKSNLASMGIYIFTWAKLKEYLIKDEENVNSSNDFGHDVLPAMLNDGNNMFAYEFEGYWKDVGTVESLWEANMDILDPNVPLNLNAPSWKVYSRNNNYPPQFIGEEAVLKNCSITEGCEVYGTVENSIIFPGVKIGKGAVVKSAVVMPDCVIEDGAVVEYTIVAAGVKIGKDAHVGKHDGELKDGAHPEIAVIGQDLTIGDGVVVAAGAAVSENMTSEAKEEA